MHRGRLLTSAFMMVLTIAGFCATRAGENQIQSAIDGCGNIVKSSKRILLASGRNAKRCSSGTGRTVGP